MRMSAQVLKIKEHCCMMVVGSLTYCIAGNFGEIFNLANWRFCGKSPNLKPTNNYFIHCRTTRKRSRSPNLKFANAF